MKKTLIALAVLAASGASFAQVTITGTLAMGYKASKSVGSNTVANISGLGVPFAAFTGAAATSGADASGFGVDTSEIDFNAVEDLGGGQKIEAALALAGADRSGESGNGTVNGRDATLTYTNTSFGRIRMGTTQPAAVHSGIPSAGAPVVDMDGKLFQVRTNSDFISYAAPIGPVIFQYSLTESSAGLGLGAGASGAQGTAVGQRTSDFAVVYDKGPLQLVGVYRSYDNRDNTAINSPLGLTKDNVYVVQAGYNMGVAKLGFGYNFTTATVGAKVADMLLGVSVPMGPLTLGMTLGRSTASGISDVPATIGGFQAFMKAAEGTANSVSYGAKYDLSKRTSLTAKYASWTRSGYEQFEAFGAAVAKDVKNGVNATAAGYNNQGLFGYQPNATEFSILLSHSF